jgi:hypothetical protein
MCLPKSNTCNSVLLPNQFQFAKGSEIRLRMNLTMREQWYNCLFIFPPILQVFCLFTITVSSLLEILSLVILKGTLLKQWDKLLNNVWYHSKSYIFVQLIVMWYAYIINSSYSVWKRRFHSPVLHNILIIRIRQSWQDCHILLQKEIL